MAFFVRAGAVFAHASVNNALAERVPIMSYNFVMDSAQQHRATADVSHQLCLWFLCALSAAVPRPSLLQLGRSPFHLGEQEFSCQAARKKNTRSGALCPLASMRADFHGFMSMAAPWPSPPYIVRQPYLNLITCLQSKAPPQRGKCGCVMSTEREAANISLSTDLNRNRVQTRRSLSHRPGLDTRLCVLSLPLKSKPCGTWHVEKWGTLYERHKRNVDQMSRTQVFGVTQSIFRKRSDPPSESAMYKKFQQHV